MSTPALDQNKYSMRYLDLIENTQQTLRASLKHMLDGLALDLVEIPGRTGDVPRLEKIVDISGRKTVVVRQGGGQLPFYCSTGRGGKEQVKPGRWYPFFGIGPMVWFNKGSQDQINRYYCSKVLRSIAGALDQRLGNISEMDNTMFGIPVVSRDSLRVINQGLDPAAPEDLDNPSEAAKWGRMVATAIHRMDPSWNGCR